MEATRPKRTLTAFEVLTIIAQRLEKRAAVLDAVGMAPYSVASMELRIFAGMMRKAIGFLQSQGGKAEK